MVNFRRVDPLKWQFVNVSDEILDESMLQWTTTPTSGDDCALVGAKGQFVPTACSGTQGTRIICETGASGKIPVCVVYYDLLLLHVFGLNTWCTGF